MPPILSAALGPRLPLVPFVIPYLPLKLPSLERATTRPETSNFSDFGSSSSVFRVSVRVLPTPARAHSATAAASLKTAIMQSCTSASMNALRMYTVLPRAPPPGPSATSPKSKDGNDASSPTALAFAVASSSDESVLSRSTYRKRSSQPQIARSLQMAFAFACIATSLPRVYTRIVIPTLLESPNS